MRRLVNIYIILTYMLWISSVWSFTKVNVEYNDIVLNNYKLMASPKITYKGPGRKVADRIKEQFSVSSDFEVRQVRKALKRYKRTEERRLIKKRRNIVSSERNVDGAVKRSRSTLKDRSFKVVSKYTVKENEFTHFLRPLEKYTEKNPLGKATIKPVRMGIPLDTAASLYEGASPVVPTKSSPSQISTLEFIGSYIHTAILPSLALPEICLVGRSNVGKSSFINTMMTYMKTRRKSCDMAFVSKTPGYTKCINIFKAVDTKGRDVLSIADLPGYGFVKIKNRETVHAMNSALRAYLQRRNELKFIIFLIDGSLEPQSSDMEVHEMLKSMGIPFIIVCTKMDKVAQTQIPGQILLFRQVYKIESPLPIAFSKYGGADLGGIWGAIFDACRDKFDLANLSIADSYKSVKGADFEQYIKRQSMVSTKDLKELIYKNFELLPDSLKSANIDSMTKDELLDVLRVAAERSDFIRSKPIDLLEYKKKQTNR